MKVGFTGTRLGMTPAQMGAFYRLICELPTFAEFHHGDCVGADDEAADVVNEMLQSAEDGDHWEIVCHPPVDEKLRAFNKHADRTMPPKNHFARNRDIVDETDILVATPMQAERQTRGGTWYTIDYARKKGKPVYVVNPDGTVDRQEAAKP